MNFFTRNRADARILSAEELVNNDIIKLVFGMWGFSLQGNTLINLQENVKITVIDSTKFSLQIDDGTPELVTFEGRNKNTPLPLKMKIDCEDASVVLHDISSIYAKARDEILKKVSRKGKNRGSEKTMSERLASLKAWRSTFETQPSKEDLRQGMKLLTLEQISAMMTLDVLQGKNRFERFASMLEDSDSAPAILLFCATLTSQLVSISSAQKEAEDTLHETGTHLDAAKSDLSVSNPTVTESNRSMYSTFWRNALTQKILKSWNAVTVIIQLTTVAGQIFAHVNLGKTSAQNHNILQNSLQNIGNRVDTTADAINYAVPGLDAVTSIANSTNQTLHQVASAFQGIPKAMLYAQNLAEKLQTPREDDAPEEAYCQTLVTSASGSIGLATSYIFFRNKAVSTIAITASTAMGSIVSPVVCLPVYVYRHHFNATLAPSWFKVLYDYAVSNDSTSAPPLEPAVQP